MDGTCAAAGCATPTARYRRCSTSIARPWRATEKRVPWRPPSGWGELFGIDISAAPEALNLIGGAMLLVRMRRKSAFAPPDIDRLESVFAITHAEAAVLAGALATGHGVEEVATLRNASVLTVRKQVASLLNKMECSRQSELVRLASLL